MDWNKILQEKNLRVSFLRDYINGESVIVGTIIADATPDKDGCVIVGMSGKGPDDNPCKDTGKRVAYKRYCAAKHIKDNGLNMSKRLSHCPLTNIGKTIGVRYDLVEYDTHMSVEALTNLINVFRSRFELVADV